MSAGRRGSREIYGRPVPCLAPVLGLFLGGQVMDLASPAPLLGHILPGAAMSYAQLEALRFLAACFGIGAAIGLIRGIVVELRRS